MIRQLIPVTSETDQTDFEIPGGYTPNSLILTVNGVILQPGDFSATDGLTVRPVAGLVKGDQVGGLFGGVGPQWVHYKPI